MPSGTRAQVCYLLGLPDSRQEVISSAHIDYTLAGSSLRWDEYPLAFAATKNREDLIDEAIGQVAAISVTTHCDRHRKDEVLDTLEDLKRRPPSRWGQIDRAIRKITKSLRTLGRIDADTHQAHLAVGRVLTYWQARWSK